VPPSKACSEVWQKEWVERCLLHPSGVIAVGGLSLRLYGQDGKEQATLWHHDPNDSAMPLINVMCVLGDGRLVCSSVSAMGERWSPPLHLWDLATGRKEEIDGVGHVAQINAMIPFPGPRLITADQHGYIKVWRSVDGE
jgi:hypothetical protein